LHALNSVGLAEQNSKVPVFFLCLFQKSLYTLAVFKYFAMILLLLLVTGIYAVLKPLYALNQEVMRSNQRVNIISRLNFLACRLE
jgi:hypothetical protein